VIGILSIGNGKIMFLYYHEMAKLPTLKGPAATGRLAPVLPTFSKLF
jgi:hypothetical protein